MKLLRSNHAAAVLTAAVLIYTPAFFVGCRPRPEGRPSRVTLHVWTTESDRATLDVMEDVGRQLVKSDPNVERVAVTSVRWSDLNVKIQQAYEARRLPAITHLEPFFTRTFVTRKLLLPLDDVVADIGETNIEKAVRREAWFDGHYYGIPQHIGVSFMVYRKDLLDAAGVAVPTTWDEMISTCQRLTEPAQKRYPVYFPGGDRFFVDAIFFETLASNGGRAYHDDGTPDLDNPRVVETLEYMKRLISCTSPDDWQSATYVSGFQKLIRGDVTFVLFAGARATKDFANDWHPSVPGIKASDVFLPMPPPRGPHGKTGISSIDSEPFVLVDPRRNGGTEAESRAVEAAGKQYLRLLFRHDNYLKLVRSVPIQLLPIFTSLSEEYGRDPSVQEWHLWYDQALTMIRERRANPYFVTRPEELAIPYLYNLYSDQVITGMVLSVLTGERTVAEAAQRAQEQAEQIRQNINEEK